MSSKTSSLLFELAHSIAVIVAGLIGWLFGYPSIFAGSMAMFFLGRELAQAEYKWIGWFGFGKRANMPWWAVFDHRVWNVHSFWWNLTLPTVIFFVFILLEN